METIKIEVQISDEHLRNIMLFHDLSAEDIKAELKIQCEEYLNRLLMDAEDDILGD